MKKIIEKIKFFWNGLILEDKPKINKILSNIIAFLIIFSYLFVIFYSVKLFIAFVNK